MYHSHPRFLKNVWWFILLWQHTSMFASVCVYQENCIFGIRIAVLRKNGTLNVDFIKIGLQTLDS